jgi:hypothetical protein
MVIVPLQAGVFEVGFVEQTLDQFVRDGRATARGQYVPTVLKHESKGRGTLRLSFSRLLVVGSRRFGHVR